MYLENFQIKYGTPSEKPERPVVVDDAIEIATSFLPAYLYNVRDISFNFLQYKRYQMKDIKNLEDRIKNLEYYTALSLLETETESLVIKDTAGLDRFKNGILADPFRGHSVGNVISSDLKTSISSIKLVNPSVNQCIRV